VITYYVEDTPSDDENADSPDTGVEPGWMLATLFSLLSGAAVVLLRDKKERAI